MPLPAEPRNDAVGRLITEAAARARSTCGCKPGTYENGWQEERSEACQRAESEAFARSIEAGHAWAREHLGGSAFEFRNTPKGWDT